MLVKFWRDSRNPSDSVKVNLVFADAIQNDLVLETNQILTKPLDEEWVKVSGRCKISDTILTSDPSQVKEIVFYVAGLDPSYDIWLDDVIVEIYRRDDSWKQGNC